MRRAFWPIVWIVLGAVLLAVNLGYVRFAEIRHLILTWWPALLIVIGVAQLLERRR